MQIKGNVIKRIISFFSIFFILQSIANNQTLIADETCTLVSSQPFGLAGDDSGKRIHTKEEFVFECTDTTTKIGSCNKWEEKYKDYNVSGLEHDVYYESENFQGSIGEILAVTQAYDKINGVWGGWHGLCQDGADDGNWDWMSDPYVLAGFALSAVSAGVAASANSASQAAIAAQTAIETTSDTTIAMAEAAKATAAAAQAAQAVAEITAYAVCAARVGLDVGKMVEEYNDDGEPCDVVDEICDGNDIAEDDTNIFTINEDEYYEMINNNPDMVDNIVIIDGVGSGVLTLKVISGDVDTTEMSSEEAQQAAKDAKEAALKIKAAMTTLQLASCVGGMDSGSGSSSSSDAASSLLSAENVSLMALGAINPLLGLGAQVLSNVYDSVATKIDTCNNIDDAKEKGSRHEATYHAEKYGMCHLVEVIEDGKKILSTYQRRFRYCCYDNETTRIIVEQVKAQLARNWNHCTDITIKELAIVSFSSCDPVALDAGINGVDLSSYATVSERITAYQFTHNCIDTREYIEVLLDKFGSDDMYIDSSDAERIIEEMR